VAVNEFAFQSTTVQLLLLTRHFNKINSITHFTIPKLWLQIRSRGSVYTASGAMPRGVNAT